MNSATASVSTRVSLELDLTSIHRTFEQARAERRRKVKARHHAELLELKARHARELAELP